MKSQMILMIAIVGIIATIPSAFAEPETVYRNHKVIEVTGFEGTIQITEDSDRKSLKEQITVSLSDAASLFPEAKRAGIGIAVNQDGEKFVVWKIIEVDFDSDSKTRTKTIHVVDAANISNTGSVSFEMNNSMRIEKMTDRLDRKIDRITEKFGDSTGDPVKDALITEMLSTMESLRNAVSEGDFESAKDLKQQVKDIRDQIKNIPRE